MNILNNINTFRALLISMIILSSTLLGFNSAYAQQTITAGSDIVAKDFMLLPPSRSVKPFIVSASLTQCLGEAAAQCRAVQSISEAPAESERYFQYQKALLTFTVALTQQAQQHTLSWKMIDSVTQAHPGNSFVGTRLDAEQSGFYRVRSGYLPVVYKTITSVVALDTAMHTRNIHLEATLQARSLGIGGQLTTENTLLSTDNNAVEVTPKGNPDRKINFSKAVDIIKYAPSIRKIFIANLGDSYSAGVGAPDRGVEYSNNQCDRSTFAAATQAVEFMRNTRSVRDNQFEIVYTNLACSGATINVGVLGPYSGPTRWRILTQAQVTNRVGQDDLFNVIDYDYLEAVAPIEVTLPSQIDQLAHFTQTSQSPGIDLVTVTVGSNDSGFVDIITACSQVEFAEDCDIQTAPSIFENGLILAHTATPGASELPLLYNNLAQKLVQFDIDKVIATGYPSVGKIRNRRENLVSCPQVNDDYVLDVIVNENVLGNKLFRGTPGIELFPSPPRVAGAAMKAVSAREWRYLNRTLTPSLNSAIRSSVNEINQSGIARARWVFARNYFSSTANVGLCAGLVPPNFSSPVSRQRGFNTFKDSIENIRTLNGAVHPNQLGYSRMANALVPLLRTSIRTRL